MAKDTSTTDKRPIRRLLRRLVHAPTAVSILWPAVLFCGGYLAWHSWGAQHVASQYYGVDKSLIELTESPSFIHEDIVDTVYRDTGLSDLSLLDAQATAKIASAFSMHPWIERVVSVRKLPKEVVKVHVVYRQPVAMVYYHGPDPRSKDSTAVGDYFYPVDRYSTMLSTEDLSPAQIRDYIHIVIPGVSPAAGLLGAKFGDRRVEFAAGIAALLAEYRERAQIESITVSGDERIGAVPQYELTTFAGSRFHWGSPPGYEVPDEPSALQKLKRLLQGVEPGEDLRMATRGVDAADH